MYHLLLDFILICTQDIADISKQFPAIADDFRLPDLFPKEQFFSSVFRIGSQGMQLWTHYDVSSLLRLKSQNNVLSADID